jgi:hypothetical protein
MAVERSAVVAEPMDENGVMKLEDATDETAFKVVDYVDELFEAKLETLDAGTAVKLELVGAQGVDEYAATRLVSKGPASVL